MAFGGARYTLLGSRDDADTSLRTSSKIGSWLSSRRIRFVALITMLLFLASTILMLPGASQLHNFSPQHVYDTFKNSTGLQSANKMNNTVGEIPPETKAPESVEAEHNNAKVQEEESEEEEVEKVDWSGFAYVQYVTNANYLCNSLMILEALYRLGTKADRIMMYPRQWQVPDSMETATTSEGRFLAQARDDYLTKLIPITVQTFERGDPTWKDSYTKLLAFNQTQYKRLVSLDSDAIVRDTMDELFLLPSSPIAMPRAYWIDQPFLSSQLVVFEPSTLEWDRVENFMIKNQDAGFDMDILNKIYGESALVIPHRRYDLLTSEFKSSSHEKYLGNQEQWNGTKILEKAKFVHFSDWPVPKPWLNAGDAMMDDNSPDCRKVSNGTVQDCVDRDIWRGFYADYSAQRKKICGREYDGKRRSLALRSQGARPWFEPVLPW